MGTLHYDIVISLWGQGMECGILNAIDAHRLIGRGTIRSCDLEVGIVLLEGWRNCSVHSNRNPN